MSETGDQTLDALLQSAQTRSSHGTSCWAILLREQGGRAEEYIDHLERIRDEGGYLNYSQISRDLASFGHKRTAPNVGRHLKRECSCPQ